MHYDIFHKSSSTLVFFNIKGNIKYLDFIIAKLLFEENYVLKSSKNYSVMQLIHTY